MSPLSVSNSQTSSVALDIVVVAVVVGEIVGFHDTTGGVVDPEVVMDEGEGVGKVAAVGCKVGIGVVGRSEGAGVVLESPSVPVVGGGDPTSKAFRCCISVGRLPSDQKSTENTVAGTPCAAKQASKTGPAQATVLIC